MPDEHYRQSEARHQHREGHDPGNSVETRGGGRGQNGSSIFLHERLQDEVVTVAAAQTRSQFVSHASRSRTADVVALEQNLIASAGADQLVANGVEARIVE